MTARDLSRWRLVEDFKERPQAAATKPPLAATWSHPERLLAASDYLSLCLLGLLNPVVQTLRGLSAASRLHRVQREVCTRPVSLGSFSEAQAVLDPALLAEVFAQLSGEVCAGPTPDAARQRPWLIQDESLFAALPRMYWAFWRRQGPTQCQVRLHLSLDLAHAAPARAHLTPSKVCERAAWVTLGCQARYRSIRLRVVWVQTEKEVLRLVTNLGPEELSAGEVALLYKERWRIELFFRWLKCSLGCQHWLAESPQGVALQIYLALIAALLLQRYTGRAPTKRMLELIQFYLLGVASLDELCTGLERMIEPDGLRRVEAIEINELTLAWSIHEAGAVAALAVEDQFEAVHEEVAFERLDDLARANGVELARGFPIG